MLNMQKFAILIGLLFLIPMVLADHGHGSDFYPGHGIDPYDVDYRDNVYFHEHNIKPITGHQYVLSYHGHPDGYDPGHARDHEHEDDNKNTRSYQNNNYYPTKQSSYPSYYPTNYYREDNTIGNPNQVIYYQRNPNYVYTSSGARYPWYGPRYMNYPTQYLSYPQQYSQHTRYSLSNYGNLYQRYHTSPYYGSYNTNYNGYDYRHNTRYNYDYRHDGRSTRYSSNYRYR